MDGLDSNYLWSLMVLYNVIFQEKLFYFKFNIYLLLNKDTNMKCSRMIDDW